MPLTRSKTLAQLFAEQYSEYLFQDAHFYVEAAATLEAKELSHNRFQFLDGSVLEIRNDLGKVVCSEAASAEAIC